ncbi:MAG: Crp/Fnr family transcriptional regulator [Clostridiales bacterium]|nr:Crp/Fnr family transcriptional regulator [Clostridiales bacterium]
MKNILQEFPMFQTVDLKKIQYSTKTYPEKSIIKFSGDTCETFGVILFGEAVIEHIDSDGNLMTVASFEAAATIGGNRMFASDNAFPMTISAKQTTGILYIDKETIMNLCQTNRIFLEYFLRDVANKSDLLSHRIRNLKFVSIEDQIVNYLKKVKLSNNSDIFDLKISKKEWAERMGIQRTSLSRALQKMKKKGWISYKNHHFELVNSKIFD